MKSVEKSISKGKEYFINRISDLDACKKLCFIALFLSIEKKLLNVSFLKIYDW